MNWEFPAYSENFNWKELADAYSWVADMSGVKQDPIHHAEGDVAIHTDMVLKEMFADPDFKTLSVEDKHIMFASILLHDVEKRSTTVEENGRITAKNHAKKGELTARSILYKELPTPFLIRERICKIVRFHGIPIWTAERSDPQRAFIKTSLLSKNSLLELIAKCDVKGRICKDKDDIMFRIDMFSEMCKEFNCLERPYEFKSDMSLFHYFNGAEPNAWPDYVPFNNTKFDVIIMSGLPGSGKDSYIKKYLPGIPVVSIDDIRRELGVKHGDKKGNGHAIQAAKEKAREYMRKKTTFIWNATNVTLDMRRQLVNFFLEYGAYVRIVYVEVPYKTLLEQNRNREYAIPEAALQKLINKLEVPDITEAHHVTHYAKI